MMGINRFYILLKKYRKQNCTPQELEELSDWYEQFNREADGIPKIPDKKLEVLFEQIEQRINRPRLRRRKLAQRVGFITGIAAMLVLCLLVGRYLLPMQSDQISLSEVEKETSLIRPGHSQAELVLSDGSRIKLDKATIVKDKSGKLIKRDTSSRLDYTLVERSNAQEIFNTICVPMGGEYGIILADGTEVWLNSGSTLKYPMVFGDKKREVVLSGEGFFKVSKSSVPFIVKTFDLDIKVLGTSFNVSAYGNDEYVQTTLVNGSVMVYNNHDSQSYRLEPGHILSYSKVSDEIIQNECDTDLYTSWVNGEFKFRDMRLEDIMKKLNRWYNCQIKYENENLKNLRFSGVAEKDKSVNYLLDMIRIVTDVDFKVDGQTIVVKTK